MAAGLTLAVGAGTGGATGHRAITGDVRGDRATLRLTGPDLDVSLVGLTAGQLRQLQAVAAALADRLGGRDGAALRPHWGGERPGA